eukprot:jgi/Tetstr1/443819/TSEL_003273.t1
MAGIARRYRALFSTGRVAAAAAISRTFVLALMLTADALLPDYDMSSALPAGPPCEHGSAAGPPEWPRAQAALEGLITWDAVYFVRIAECGYEYEQFHAFFPALPLAMRALQRSVLWPLVPKVGTRATLALAGLLISNAAFVAAAVMLHRLSLRVLHSHRLAALSAMFFCLNPASVFYSAAYTESLYAAATFAAMLALEWRAYKGFLLAAAASAATRSNGVLNAGYLAHHCLRRSVKAVRAGRPWRAVGVLVWMAGGVTAVAAPLALFQWYGFRSFCGAGVDPDEAPPWCADTVPYLYGYVQRHYWGVGFLTYYQPQQIPNFALALPILACPHPPPRRVPRTLGPRVTVYVIHWAALTAVAAFVMHVQVATRFLSASPPLYWFAAHLWVQRRARRALLAHCLLFTAVGAVLHPTFLPWT